MNKKYNIELEISNYKGIKNQKTTIKDTNMIIVQGQNSSGKTSLMNLFEEGWSAKALIEQPVKKGQEKGYKYITIPDKNGNSITIKHDFSINNTKGKFIAIQNDKTITSAKKIRELLGDYYPISVEEFFNLSKTIPGRRNIIENYLFNLLSQQEKDNIKTIDAYVDTTNGTLIEERKTLKESIISYKNIIKNKELTKEQHQLLNNKDEIIKQLEILKEEKVTIIGSEEQKDFMNVKIEILTKEKDSIYKLNIDIEDKEKLDSFYQIIIEEYNGFISLLPIYDKEKIDKLNTRITNGDIVIKDIDKIEFSQENLTKDKDLLKQKEEKLIIIEQNIIDKRQEKKNILSNSNLPAGLIIEDDDFSLNGFKFRENQIGEAEAKLVIAELLIKLNTSKLINMGNMGDFDDNNLSKLQKIVEKHDRLLILTRVVSNLPDVELINYVNDVNKYQKPEEVKKESNTTTQEINKFF